MKTYTQVTVETLTHFNREEMELIDKGARGDSDSALRFCSLYLENLDHFHRQVNEDGKKDKGGRLSWHKALDEAHQNGEIEIKGDW